MIKYLDLQAITAQHADEYKAALCRVADAGWFLQGKEIACFEQSYAAYLCPSSAGTEAPLHCVTVANGLDALTLILRGYQELGVMHEGDEVIVPANTYIATILAITRCGMTPVLVEPTFEHLEMDVDRVETAITSRTRAILLVHLYGRNAYYERYQKLCEKYGLKLIEDCAQSHGCAWYGVKTGALGHAAAHSFYPGKNLGAFGDAGAVTTSDAALAEVVRALANYGSQSKYVFRYQGINSRMSETDAAVLSVKLKYLDQDNRKRQELATFYYQHISNQLITLPLQLADEQNVYHIFPVFCPQREALQQYLAARGVQTMIHYPIPPHQQECYATASWNQPRLSLPITERIHAEELSIPLNQSMTLADTARVVEALNEFSL